MAGAIPVEIEIKLKAGGDKAAKLKALVDLANKKISDKVSRITMKLIFI